MNFGSTSAAWEEDSTLGNCFAAWHCERSDVPAIHVIRRRCLRNGFASQNANRPSEEKPFHHTRQTLPRSILPGIWR